MAVRLDVKLLAGKNITRPQLAFKDSIDNSLKSPFIPQLTYKPHSLKPLSILIEYSDQNEEIYSHPYLFEIDNLKLPVRQVQKTALSSTVPNLDETEMVFVDSKLKLEQLIHELKDCTVSHSTYVCMVSNKKSSWGVGSYKMLCRKRAWPRVKVLLRTYPSCSKYAQIRAFKGGV